MILHPNASKALQVAANKAIWRLKTASDITFLLNIQNFTITKEQAHDLVEAMEVIEENLTGMSPKHALGLLTTSADAIYAAVLALHFAVTGEEVSEY